MKKSFYKVLKRDLHINLKRLLYLWLSVDDRSLGLNATSENFSLFCSTYGAPLPSELTNWPTNYVVTLTLKCASGFSVGSALEIL